MTYDEFKNKITLGYCNSETHIGVTIFYSNKENPETNFDEYIELKLPRKVPIHKFLNIEFKQIYETCEPIFKKLFEKMQQNK